ncbi:AMP-binding protein [Reinekea blandensis]|uniref:AMP-binding protein n=1 Tax=Reinekea blandensis MED297 TaxID=314283 RepID=A4BEH3_9GAMM|nr:AMP-binding protein [Reinekea blandensis]EAR09400.1 AMP-binding protein [Reinekea sp. MED297] [Reinekea blandensis MED297]
MTYPTPLEALLRHTKNHPDRPFLHQPVNRKLLITTWKQAETQARQVATGLVSLGLTKGDKVAILAKNSAEWFITDWAIMMAGMISVPIYATAGEKTIRYILEHSEAKAVFVGKLDDKAAASAVLTGELPVIAYPYDTVSAQHQWRDWIRDMEPMEHIYAPTLDETMSIVYTSGSTGNPKGVVLTYLNYASVSDTHARSFEASGEDRMVSYLPLAHITERGVVEGPGLYAGASFYFVESLDTFVDDLKVAQPTLFVSVPRLWTRFQTGVFEKMPAQKLSRLLKIPVLGKLVARKIRKGLGIDAARLYGSGSAPISPSILQWYRTIGIDICEGWGMSETTGLSCTNMPFDPELIGTIGRPCDCVEMKLSDQGEILIRGDAVFKQYYKNPEATEASFVDGWFRTGDKAQLLNNGAFKIIGRVKEEFKTGKGKYVAPVPIESALASNPDIEQICVMGSGRKQPVAVVVLAEHLMHSDKALLRPSLETTLHEVNAGLESHQKLDCLIVAQDSWTIENEFLTPTLKIRRAAVEDRYNRIAQAAEGQAVIWEDEVKLG